MEMTPYIVQTVAGERTVDAYVFGLFAAHPAAAGCLEPKVTEDGDQWVVSFCGWRFPLSEVVKDLAIDTARTMEEAFEESWTLEQVDEVLEEYCPTFRNTAICPAGHPELIIFSEVIDYWNMHQLKMHRGESFPPWMGV